MNILLKKNFQHDIEIYVALEILYFEIKPIYVTLKMYFEFKLIYVALKCTMK